MIGLTCLRQLSKAACAAPPPSLSGEEAAPATPFPGVKLKVDVTLIEVLTRDPEEVAQQLLLIDLELFQAIPVNEFLMGNVRARRFVVCLCILAVHVSVIECTQCVWCCWMCVCMLCPLFLVRCDEYCTRL